MKTKTKKMKKMRMKKMIEESAWSVCGRVSLGETRNPSRQSAREGRERDGGVRKRGGKDEG